MNSPRIKAKWPPELRATCTQDSDINAGVHTSAIVEKSGVFWIDGVQVRLRQGQWLRCPCDAYVRYLGDGTYKPGEYT